MLQIGWARLETKMATGCEQADCHKKIIEITTHPPPVLSGSCYAHIASYVMLNNCVDRQTLPPSWSMVRKDKG